MTLRGVAWGLAAVVLSAVVVPVSVSAQSVVVVTFGLDPAAVVEDLPAHAADSPLEARAERAVEVSTFRVSVRPDDSTRNGRGCNQVFDFELSGGDKGEVERSLGGIPSGSNCRFRATLTGAPAPFVIVNAGGTTFDTADAGRGGALDVDLSGLVRLPWGRIVIIQDVTGSNNRGSVSYRVDRFCGGVTSHDSLPGGRTVAPLVEGRFTVHSSDYANFGAGASYLAVALSTTANHIVGCSVTVEVIDPPATCTVAPSTFQISTWRSIGPIEHFDFEFDFACEDGGTDGGAPPTTPPGIDTTTTVADPESATAKVRVAARLRGDGRVEFALQQGGTAGGWADRRLPARRFFPADAAVDSWLASSPLMLQGADGETIPNGSGGETVVRVVARLLGDGRVEFALQRRGDGGRWSDGLLPVRRYFPADAGVNSWLVSSPVILLDTRRGTATRT